MRFNNKQLATLIVIFGIAFIISQPNYHPPPPPPIESNASCTAPSVFLNNAEISAINAKKTTEPWKTAYNKLISDANAALSRSYYSVRTDGAGDTYPSSPDYYDTLAPYAWPCAEAPAGCTRPCSSPSQLYAVCDGLHWPDNPRADYNAARNMAKDVRNLALAYSLTGNAQYASKAIYFINHWTVNSTTKMAPRYTDGQSKIELSITMPAMFYGADLLYNYSGWNAGDKSAFMGWVRSFSATGMNWNATNNYENWRNVVLLSSSLLLDNRTMFDYAVNNWKAVIPSHINSQGYMTQELSRTDSLEYSMYALNAMVQGAEIARHGGVNLYVYQTSDGRGLRLALDRYAPYAVTPSTWPFQQVEPYDGANAALFEPAYSYFGDSDYLAAVNRWGRPMYEIRIMGPVTLTHSRGTYALQTYPFCSSGGTGGDTARPSVSLTSPANGATISGTATVAEAKT